MKSACFRVALLLLLLAPCACRRREQPAPAKPAARPSALPRNPSGPASSAPSAQAPGAPPPSPPLSSTEKAASQLVRAWSDALDRHDVEKLAPLYGDSVRMYGRRMSRQAVLESKRAAFAKQPKFEQQIIGDLTFEGADDAALAVRFLKRSGEQGKSMDAFEAKLVLAKGDAGTFVIVEETDELAERQPSQCETVAAQVVNELPAVKRALDAAQSRADKSGGRERFGGIGPNSDGDGGFSASYGIHSDESYDVIVGYSVDRKGLLRVSVPDSDDVTLPPQALRAVERACRH